jgi:hypothetical protein
MEPGLGEAFIHGCVLEVRLDAEGERAKEMAFGPREAQSVKMGYTQRGSSGS